MKAFPSAGNASRLQPPVDQMPGVSAGHGGKGAATAAASGVDPRVGVHASSARCDGEEAAGNAQKGEFLDVTGGLIMTR